MLKQLQLISYIHYVVVQWRIVVGNQEQPSTICRGVYYSCFREGVAIQQAAEITTSLLDILGNQNGTKELVAEYTLRLTYPE